MSFSFASNDDDGFSFAVIIGDYTPVDVGPVISGTFTEIGDIYNLVTTAVNDGNWHWARTDIGVTLTADGSGGWTGGDILASGTQAVGVDTSDVTFDAGGVDDTMYIIHVYQRTAAGVDSNVVYATYTKDSPPSAYPVIVGTPQNSQSASTNNLTVTLPTTRTIGDWEYLIVGHSDDREIFEPTGFTTLTPNRFGTSGVLSIRAFAREITVGNVADTTASVFAAGFGAMNAFAVETTGSGPGVADDSATTSGTDTHTGPSITTTAANSLILEAMVARLSDTGTADYVYPLSNALLLVNTQTQDAIGATTGTTFTTVGNTSTWSPTLAIEVTA